MRKVLSQVLLPLVMVAVSAVPGRALGGFAVTAIPSPTFAEWSQTPVAMPLVGDFNGDGKSDIALIGGTTWNSVPVAFSNGDGTFNVTNAPIQDIGLLVRYSGVEVVVGDFNGDGKSDIALISGPGGPGWGTIPVAFSNGDGSFNVTNVASSLAAYTAIPGARLYVADFNGDGKDDIAVLGPSSWSWIPVAFSNGDGTFNVTAVNNPLAPLAAVAGVTVLVGDFNGDGKADFALTGGAGWQSIPVAFSNGDGSFGYTNNLVANFPTWAALPNVQPLVGRFLGGKKAAIALVGDSGWNSVPLAASNGDGTFTVYNQSLDSFPAETATAGARILVGDFNGDGITDLAITGPAGWATLPVAFGKGDGSFTYTNQAITEFAGWAAATFPGFILVGDWNGDGKTDLGLIGPAPWDFLPLAFSLSAEH